MKRSALDRKRGASIVAEGCVNTERPKENRVSWLKSAILRTSCGASASDGANLFMKLDLCSV